MSFQLAAMFDSPDLVCSHGGELGLLVPLGFDFPMALRISAVSQVLTCGEIGGELCADVVDSDSFRKGDTVGVFVVEPLLGEVCLIDFEFPDRGPQRVCDVVEDRGGAIGDIAAYHLGRIRHSESDIQCRLQMMGVPCGWQVQSAQFRDPPVIGHVYLVSRPGE
ncbi:hypothetical protein CIK06_08620 [Plantactinospora sp. KBS50]|nr:hypothetical protein CIK06_08620 [Plantactinospora sp. KBS50]